MKGGAMLSWMEAYGPITAEAKIVQGEDWSAATAAVEEALESACPRAKVEEMHQIAKKELDGQSGESRGVGAGWPLVQKELLGTKFQDNGIHFPTNSIGSREEPWLKLIREGSLPCPDVLEEPGSYQIGVEWEQLLADTINKGGSKHWYGYYQYGVILAYTGKMKLAEDAFDQSIRCAVNPWALRCKAVLRDFEGDDIKAAELLVEAVDMLPEPHIAKEALQALHKAGKSQEVIDLYNKLPKSVQELGRLKVMLIEALLDVGDAAGAKHMLNGKIELTDVREGEVKLTDLWFRMTAMIKARENGKKMDELRVFAIGQSYATAF